MSFEILDCSYIKSWQCQTLIMDIEKNFELGIPRKYVKYIQQIRRLVKLWKLIFWDLNDEQS